MVESFGSFPYVGNGMWHYLWHLYSKQYISLVFLLAVFLWATFNSKQHKNFTENGKSGWKNFSLNFNINYCVTNIFILTTVFTINEKNIK